MTRIKELRRTRGETQEKMAALVGITRGAYANIENGKREPDIRTMTILADYFDVSVDYLINYKKGDLAMDERPMTFPSRDKWTEDMNEDFDNANKETRILILTRWGYDPAHAWAAHLYFPWQFQEEQSPLQTILLQNFDQLNQEGQEKLVDTSDDLIKSGKYIKSDPNRLDKTQGA